jgi:hypothetical protein
VLADLPPDVFEVVLVDGRSTDGNAEVARAHYPICPDSRPKRPVRATLSPQASRLPAATSS